MPLVASGLAPNGLSPPTVAIMISLKPLKSGAQIEWSSLEHFGGLELKTA